MSVSGSIDFNLTRNQIIKRAFEIVGITNAFETAAPEEIEMASDMLNLMIKSWEADGVYIWKEKEAALFLNIGQTKYTLGSGGTDIATNALLKTSISGDTDPAAGASSITLDTVDGTNNFSLAVNDHIGILLADNTMQWTTVTSISSSAPWVVGLAATLTGASVLSNVVYAYRTTIDKPLYITEARLRDINNEDRLVNVVSREYYNRLINKFSQGTIVSLYYQPQVLNGDIYLYQAPNDLSYNIMFSYFSSIDDFDAANDSPDFPQECLLAIIYGLVALLCPQYGKDGKLQMILPLADRYYQQLKEWNVEHVKFSTAPNNVDF